MSRLLSLIQKLFTVNEPQASGILFCILIILLGVIGLGLHFFSLKNARKGEMLDFGEWLAVALSFALMGTGLIYFFIFLGGGH